MIPDIPAGDARWGWGRGLGSETISAAASLRKGNTSGLGSPSLAWATLESGSVFGFEDPGPESIAEEMGLGRNL